MQMFKTCPFNICERFLQSYLIHVSVLWAFFILFFAFFSKVLFMQMFETCLFDICKRFLQSFLIHVSVLCGGSTCILPFFKSFVF